MFIDLRHWHRHWHRAAMEHAHLARSELALSSACTFVLADRIELPAVLDCTP